MSIISTGSYAKAMRPGVKAWWTSGLENVAEEYRDLFDTESSSMGYEEVVESVGMGLAPVKAEGKSVSYDTMKQGETTRATHVAYALGYIVTREELDDNLYPRLIQQRTRELAFSCMTTKNIVGANVYNRAFNSSYTFGDGKELLATDHPTESGDQQNELTTAATFSEAALEDLLILMDQAKNARGLQMPLKARSLIVPPALAFEAERILKSTLQNNTANNAINALNSMAKFPEGVKINHYFTSDTAFFIRTNVPDTGMMHFERTPLEMSEDNDFDTENLKYKAYERYSFTNGNFRALYGTAGL